MAYLLTALLAYLLGAIPFGLLLTRAAGLGDVRAIGSGNIGATNVLRTGRKDVAAATLLLDAAKGAVPVLAARWLAPPEAAVALPALAAACAFLGHCFPVWLGFKGGKGVATFIGGAFALLWPLGLAICGIWLLAASLSGYSSLAALVMMAAAPALAVLAGAMAPAAALLAMAALSYIRHAANIRRLLRGEESRIGAKK